MCKITIWPLHEICSIQHFYFAFRRLSVHICVECSQSSPLHTEAVGSVFVRNVDSIPQNYMYLNQKYHTLNLHHRLHYIFQTWRGFLRSF